MSNTHGKCFVHVCSSADHVDFCPLTVVVTSLITLTLAGESTIEPRAGEIYARNSAPISVLFYEEEFFIVFLLL